MTKYEIMFIIKATTEESNIKKCADATQKLIKDLKGKVVEFNELGEKTFAYPIKKEVNGYYYVMQVELLKENISEFDRKMKLDENVLRHLIIRKDEE